MWGLWEFFALSNFCFVNLKTLKQLREIKCCKNTCILLQHCFEIHCIQSYFHKGEEKVYCEKKIVGLVFCTKIHLCFNFIFSTNLSFEVFLCKRICTYTPSILYRGLIFLKKKNRLISLF